MYNYKAFLQELEDLKTSEDTAYSDILGCIVSYLQMVLNDTILYNENFIIQYTTMISYGPIFVLDTKDTRYYYIMFQYNFHSRPYQKRLLEYKTNFFIGV